MFLLIFNNICIIYNKTIMTIDALFISDVHLGNKYSKSEQLLNTLKIYQPKNLFLIGDIVDGWSLKKKHYWTQEYTNVVRKILSYSKNGTNVYYITGNHDEFLREYDFDFGNIHIVNELIWNNCFITHGDKYDTLVMNNKWLSHLGSVGYDIVLYINKYLHNIRHFFGLKPKSFSKWVKKNVKDAINFLYKFEEILVNESKKKNCNTIICGHTHTPKDNVLNGVRYLNTGDWIENCSYIIYNNNEFKLKYYGED